MSEWICKGCGEVITIDAEDGIELAVARKHDDCDELPKVRPGPPPGGSLDDALPDGIEETDNRPIKNCAQGVLGKPKTEIDVVPRIDRDRTSAERFGDAAWRSAPLNESMFSEAVKTLAGAAVRTATQVKLLTAGTAPLVGPPNAGGVRVELCPECVTPMKVDYDKGWWTCPRCSKSFTAECLRNEPSTSYQDKVLAELQNVVGLRDMKPKDVHVEHKCVKCGVGWEGQVPGYAFDGDTLAVGPVCGLCSAGYTRVTT